MFKKKLILRRLLLTFAGFFALPLWAMPFKCDKAQNLCEVQTKRMTVGDAVGVFTEDKQLVAIGRVSEIKANSRMVKIEKRWGALYRSYEMEIIPDEKFENPQKYFKILTPLPEFMWGTNLGIFNLGIGDGFIGPNADGIVRWWWKRNLYFIGRVHYISGSGEASDNLGAAGTQKVNLSTFGISGGLSELVAAHEQFAMRLEGDLGFSSTSVTINGGFDEKKVLNNRIADGVGLFARLGVSGVWRRDGLEPEVGFTYLRLQNSNNFGLFVGIGGAI